MWVVKGFSSVITKLKGVGKAGTLLLNTYIFLHSKNERFFGELKQVFQLSPYWEPILDLWTWQLGFMNNPKGFSIRQGFFKWVKSSCETEDWTGAAPSSLWVCNTVNWAIQETYFAVIM